MVVTCEHVWQEVSNYLENDLDPALRTALDEHFRTCPQCASVLAGTRNIVQLYGDERLFQVPLGFSGRLQKRLAKEMPAKRGTIFGWVVAAAALALIAGALFSRDQELQTKWPNSRRWRSQAIIFLQACRYWCRSIPKFSTSPVANIFAPTMARFAL